MKKENDIILEKANQSVVIVCNKEKNTHDIKLSYFVNNNHKVENGKDIKVNPGIDFPNYELFYYSKDFYYRKDNGIVVYCRKDMLLILEISLKRATTSFFLSKSCQNLLCITIYDASKESYFTIGLDPSNNKNNKTPSKNLTLLKSNEKSKYYCLNQFNNEETKLLLEL